MSVTIATSKRAANNTHCSHTVRLYMKTKHFTQGLFEYAATNRHENEKMLVC